MAAVDPAPHLFSVEDVTQMAESGILDPDGRYELIDGVLYDLMHPGPDHAGITARLNRLLVLGCPDAEVRVQDTLLIERGFLSPDVIVVEPLGRTALPHSALLAVEVTVTTMRHDTFKAELYAAAGVLEYWLVDVRKERVLVHRRPSGDEYGETKSYGRGETVPASARIPALVVAALVA